VKRPAHGTTANRVATALVEPLSVGWHAVAISPYQSGDSALVLGGGPIGLSVIQALKARGCENIIVSEVSSMRKQYASDFGAHHILDPTKDDIVARCRELCDGKGVHMVFDAAGVQAALNQAVKAVRARGTVVNIALWEKPFELQPNDMIFRERKWIGVATYQKGDFQEVLAAISSGRMKNVENMITKRIGLDEVVEQGFRALVKVGGVMLFPRLIETDCDRRTRTGRSRSWFALAQERCERERRGHRRRQLHVIVGSNSNRHVYDLTKLYEVNSPVLL
jgi:2-desacetyl-2-hydroxyethyl bacteriochlorophyllide A dehydrogenase